ncbi:uncharacterized protein LOC111405887 [Olea europaea var. sylvestris]|uniref:uncharacterized protein LOC111405887 n=1 Tax=Olea europaea var. sylvestris TaxID=158386 RepID=UPI000C1D2DB2|nr:uncharacterized protein LOC111405887 [Olea europaea var. sylvestris]
MPHIRSSQWRPRQSHVEALKKGNKLLFGRSTVFIRSSLVKHSLSLFVKALSLLAEDSFPGNGHWIAMKWLLKYLKDNDVRLMYKQSKEGVKLEGFPHLDLAEDMDIRRSIHIAAGSGTVSGPTLVAAALETDTAADASSGEISIQWESGSNAQWAALLENNNFWSLVCKGNDTLPYLTIEVARSPMAASGNSSGISGKRITSAWEEG